MQTSAFRVEVIRFSLLVTLTVALLSVAIRLASHSDSHSTLRPGALPSGSSAPTSTTPPSTTSPPAPRATSTPPSTVPTATPTAGSGGDAGGGSGGPSTQPVLPVTGDDALKLIATSLLLIGGGAQAVRLSRR